MTSNKEYFMEKQNYRITELNPDGSEELMWEGYCTKEKMKQEFSRIIGEQQKIRREKNTKWRQVRVYNQLGELILVES